MSSILVLRERFKQIYAAYSFVIIKAARFVLALAVFVGINSSVGFMESLSSVFIALVLAAVCAFFPTVLTTLAAVALILLHFYALSAGIALICAAVFVVMYIFYFRFAPHQAWIALAAALAFGLKIPLVIPVVVGLVCTASGAVPAFCGVVVYYMLNLVKTSATALKSAESDSMLDSVTNFTGQFFANKEMWAMACVTALGILVVFGIRMQQADHAWKIASAAGEIFCFAASIIVNVAFSLHMPFLRLILSAILGFIVGLGLEIIFFSVDYTRTERVQFEDDEYYYYVKAVPKTKVRVPRKQVKRITDSHEGQHRPTNGQDSVHAAASAGGQGSSRTAVSANAQSSSRAAASVSAHSSAHAAASSNGQSSARTAGSAYQTGRGRSASASAAQRDGRTAAASGAAAQARSDEELLLTRSLNRELGLSEEQNAKNGRRYS